MNDPAQKDKPEPASQYELDNGHQQTALQQLTQSGNKETTEGCQYITARSLTCHAFDRLK